jgi:hypothetical protein
MDSLSTTINITFVTADTIGVSYETMPDNTPHALGNLLLLWETSDGSIPWTVLPLHSYSIPDDAPNGTTEFTGLNLSSTGYIIGYSVGPFLMGSGMQAFGNVCSSAFVPNLVGPNTILNASVSLVEESVSSVIVKYSLPNGLLPQSNGAWAGIWMDHPSYTSPPLMAVPISYDASNGTIEFNNIHIDRGLVYSVALFTSGYSSKEGSGQAPMAAGTFWVS